MGDRSVSWAEAEVAIAITEFGQKKFSTAISNHEDHIARGSYAISLVVALIEEGHSVEARSLAQQYVDGTAVSIGKHIHLGKDFHELAIEWIDGNASAVD
ncbi:MAG: hypothetical protein AB8G18_17235 [Gammaproteobacteria bacterium]